MPFSELGVAVERAEGQRGTRSGSELPGWRGRAAQGPLRKERPFPGGGSGSRDRDWTPCKCEKSLPFQSLAFSRADRSPVKDTEKQVSNSGSPALHPCPCPAASFWE